MFKSVIKEEIQVPAHIDYLGELRNFVTKAGKKHNFSDTVVNAFKLSIDEAATNIIKHAYRDWDGNIKLRVIIKKNSMTVLLIDQGKYFDPSRIQDPDLNRYVNIGKKGGLGIFIIRKLIDEIDYRHTEEGNELRLTKYQDKPKDKKVIPTPTISVSLKTRYSVIAAGIITLLVILGYFYFFFKHGSEEKRGFIENKFALCNDIASVVIVSGENELNTTPEAASKVSDFMKGREDIYRYVVTDNENIGFAASDTDLMLSYFELPNNYEQIEPNLVSYKNASNETIYNFSKKIYTENEPKERLGTVYLEVKKDYISKRIAALRVKDLQLAGLILLFGYLGVVILIYLIMNPFRKLATWVKELGHGDVKDEMDFDTSDEVGEIAKAFSDITVTLRDSQKNMAEQERIQKEMQLAQDIQHTLLPAEVPKLERYQISAFYEAAKEVGGDYYDFIEVDKDTLGIVVADVAGKGVPGSLIMTMIRTALRTEARSIKSASEVLARVNDFVVKDMKKGMFVTLFYVIIDSRKRRINYASAGHNPMILYRKSTDKTYYLNPRGFPVGISLPNPELFKQSIESDTIQLAEDDVLILYTDGITEAMNERRELFGEERLQKVIREKGHLSIEEFTEALKNEIYSFTEGFNQNDDITLVAIKEESSPEKIELQRAQQAHKMILQGKNIRESCEECGITVYAYYNKYKKIFEEEGVDAFEIDETISVEAKHLSIEEKTKIYDIIKLHPEFGAKRISEELNTERYGFTEINENRIYDELVRSRLNTRQLREAYIARSGRKKQMKPPGTPMMTLDGKIILSKVQRDFGERRYKESEEAEETKKGEEVDIRDVKETKQEEYVEYREDTELELPEDKDDDFYLESLVSVPIEDLLKKKRAEGEREEKDKEKKQKKRQHKSKGKKKSDELDFLSDELDMDQIGEFSSSKSSSMMEEELDLDNLDFENFDNDELTADLDDDVSFKDVWEKDDEEKESIIADENKSNVPLTEKNDEAKEIEDEDTFTESMVKTDVDIDDILKETGDANDEEFEILTDETSFQDEFKQDGESSIEKEKTAESLEQTLSSDDDGISQDEVTEKDKTRKLESEPPDRKEQKEKQQMKEEDIAEADIPDVDFTFNDLLEEIENEIPFYDGDADEVIQMQEIDEDGNGEFRFEALAPDEEDLNELQNNLTVAQKEENHLQNKNLLLGMRFYRQREYKKAIGQFIRVIEQYPNFKEAYSILGNAYYHHNMIDKAVESYQKVKELDPKDPDSYENTGVIYANMGRFDEAIKEWKMVMKIDPGRKDILNNIEEAKQILSQN